MHGRRGKGVRNGGEDLHRSASAAGKGNMRKCRLLGTVNGKKRGKKSLDSKKGGCYTPDDKYKIGVMNYGRWPCISPVKIKEGLNEESSSSPYVAGSLQLRVRPGC